MAGRPSGISNLTRKLLAFRSWRFRPISRKKSCHIAPKSGASTDFCENPPIRTTFLPWWLRKSAYLESKPADRSRDLRRGKEFLGRSPRQVERPTDELGFL